MTLTIENIINTINANIKAQIACKTGLDASQFRFFGLASLIRVKDESISYFQPTAVHNSGECVSVSPDDCDAAGGYHRILSKTYQDGQQWGNTRETVETSEMKLVVWGFTRALQMSQYDFERDIIVPAMPDGISLVSTNFDSHQTATEEFKGMDYLIPPEEFMFSVKYRYQWKFNRKCNKCN
ncbi:hypothetical protein FACS189434_07970 [Bacteroidia bacterium]|nr:hypothetical protein FACS189434_07970 [Bacteroidia bacterium]